VPELWTPGIAGPLDQFVERLHRKIADVARDAGVERAYVEVELQGGTRFAVDSISPEPGFGFLTLHPHPDDEREELAAIVVPLGAIARIEIDRTDEVRHPFGFTLPGP
jgi:hypothetical protein